VTRLKDLGRPTKGTVVRCEDYGKRWYVNDKLVCESSENGTKHDPIISVKGEIEILVVELTE